MSLPKRIKQAYVISLIEKKNAFLITDQLLTSFRATSAKSYHNYNNNNPASAASALQVQSTLVMSTSLISNNRLSRSEILVPVLTWIEEVTKYCGKEERLLLISPLLRTIFNVSLTSGVKLHIHIECGCSICFLHFRNSDISRYGSLDVYQRVPWNSNCANCMVNVIVTLILCKRYNDANCL